MYYLVTISYETETPKGGLKKQKTKYILQAESVEEATIIAAKYSAGDMRQSECVAVAKFPLDCVIDEKNTPEYYKN